jgi:hypothetical protein
VELTEDEIRNLPGSSGGLGFETISLGDFLEFFVPPVFREMLVQVMEELSA